MWRLLMAVVAAAAVAACGGGGSTPAGPTSAPTSARTSASAGSRAPSATATATASAPSTVTDWPGYHGAPDRAGSTSARGPRPPLRLGWQTRVDGAVYAQPIVADGRLVVATEGDSVYALDPASGRVRWRARLGRPQPLSGLPCGNLDPTGITGTPAYDATTGTVFVAVETDGAHHALVALDVTDGAVRWRRDLDVLPHRDRRAEQQRAALLVADGEVYVAFGGRYGDCGDYVGYVAAVATDGRGPVTHYAVPTARQGGIWAPPGPVVGPGGSLYVAVGNGASTGGRYDGSDAVVRLNAALRPLAFFAPSTWAADNAGDLDLGSMSPVPVAGRLVIAGKRGVVYLLAARLGGIGGQLATLDGCAAYGGAARSGARVLLPCADGIRALDVSPGSLRWAWRSSGVSGSPLVTGDLVWVPDRDAGDLVELSLASGSVVGRVHVGALSRFATPAPAGRFVVVGTLGAVVAVTGR